MDIKPFKLSGINRPYLSHLVGLFFILITFFIMLVSISQRNLNKETATAMGLRQTFQGQVEPGQTEEDIIRTQVVAGIAMKAYGSVASYFPAGEVNIERHKDKVAIRLPLREFFAPQKSTLLYAQKGFVEDVSALLAHTVSGVTQDLAVTLRTTDLSPQAQNLAAQRAGTLTRAILAGGAPLEQTAAAVEPADKDEIVLYLRVFVTDKTAAMRYIENLWQTRQEATPGAAGTNPAQ